jgi:DNA segregation ATPase FtsK/SpoIIIE, S-DNA-T family
MHVCRKHLIIIMASVTLGLAASGTYALAELSVAPPQPQPTLTVAEPAPQPTVTVAEPAPQPPLSVSSAPLPSAPAPSPQPAAPAPAQPEVPLQPAASASVVQPAASAPEIQPAASASVVQPAASAPEIQPAAPSTAVQPAATATPPASSVSAPSTPAAPINPASAVSVPPGNSTPAAPATSSVSAGTLTKDAADHASGPANAAKKFLHGRASNAGRTLRKSESSAARSQAAKDLPRFGRAAHIADKAAAAAGAAGTLSSAASDYQAQHAAGHSPVDSAGYAASRQAGGEAGAVVATLLCVPGDAASAGLIEFGCLAAGKTVGDLAGGWVYGLARSAHNSHAHSAPPNPTTQVFILPL